MGTDSRPRKLAVLGAGGLLGSALCKQAAAKGWDAFGVRSADVDARDEMAVVEWLVATSPDVLVVCAARNAGVHANMAAPAAMLAENARMAIGSIGGAQRAGVRRLLFCCSTAIYSQEAPQPLCEPYAGAGTPEQSHFGYSAAKMLAARYCQAVRLQHGFDYTALLLTNIYGAGQSYDPSRSNVTAALLARLHEAKISGAAEVTIWGTGQATRDLIFSEDAAEAILLLAERAGPADGLINVASGREVTIQELAESIAKITGFGGRLVFDPSRPEGARRRSIDISRLMSLGWQPMTNLEDGLEKAYAAYLKME